MRHLINRGGFTHFSNTHDSKNRTESILRGLNNRRVLLAAMTSKVNEKPSKEHTKEIDDQGLK